MSSKASGGAEKICTYRKYLANLAVIENNKECVGFIGCKVGCSVPPSCDRFLEEMRSAMRVRASGHGGFDRDKASVVRSDDEDRLGAA